MSEVPLYPLAYARKAPRRWCHRRGSCRSRAPSRPPPYPSPGSPARAVKLLYYGFSYFTMDLSKVLYYGLSYFTMDLNLKLVTLLWI